MKGGICMATIKCRYCKYPNRFDSLLDYSKHVKLKHKKLIENDPKLKDMGDNQFMYFLKTGKTEGTCVMCGKPTKWNDVTNKYHRFCDNPRCKKAYREVFKKRMTNKYGKTTLLNDPEQQKAMLAKRKISGVYLWTDYVHETPYTGSYEREFLRFLDENMYMDPEDVMGPSPHTYYYELDGKKHFYIPDFFIGSLNLEIEVKDDNNTHPNRLGRDLIKEKAKDRIFLDLQKRNLPEPINYLKIVGKSQESHRKFLEYLFFAKQQFANGITKAIVML